VKNSDDVKFTVVACLLLTIIVIFLGIWQIEIHTSKEADRVIAKTDRMVQEFQRILDEREMTTVIVMDKETIEMALGYFTNLYTVTKGDINGTKYRYVTSLNHGVGDMIDVKEKDLVQI